MAVVKLRVGGMQYAVSVVDAEDNWELSFGFNRGLIDEIKSMESARWNPSRKTWSIKRSNRNKFTLAFLMGKPVMEAYDRPLLDIKPRRPMPCGHGMHPKKACAELATGPDDPRASCPCVMCLGEHQVVMLAHALTRRRSIIAGKPGTGKTIVYYEALEATEGEFGTTDVPWYISTEAGLLTARFEEKLWTPQCTLPLKMTYDGVKRALSLWKPGDPPPRRVILDESQKCKGHKTQRSEAVAYLADEMETYWKGQELLIEGTGTPDPNEPVDWWMQAEIARPGFLKESSWYAERKRLAVTVERQGMAGNYPAHIQWKDGSECKLCREKLEYQQAELKQLEALQNELRTQQQAAKDAGIISSEEFDQRIAELVNPNKRVELEAIMTNQLDLEQCPHCKGTMRVPDEVSILSKRLDGLVLAVSKPKDLPEKYYRIIEIPPDPDLLRAAEVVALSATNGLDALNRCRQLSDGFLYDRDTHEPRFAGEGKMNVIRSLLEEYEDQKRLIIYAAYTASINKLVEVCSKEGWLVWKYDGKSVVTWDGRSLDEAYAAFQNTKRYPDKMVYIAHAQKGGVSLTLTAAVAAVFYSNDFMGESREQAEDRIHRIGMDINKGATIIDLIHLGTDRLIRDNLMGKREMSGLTVSHIRDALRPAA